MWQDYVFSIGNVLFSIMLISSLLTSAKPHWLTSALTSALLFLFGYCFSTLNLKLAMVASFITATAWMILFIQSMRIKYLIYKMKDEIAY